MKRTTHAHTHIHTRNHFTALWTLSRTTRVSWHQKVHFAISWTFWCKMMITQADTPTIWMDCHLIQTNWCPHLCHPIIFTPDALPGTTLPIYPGLGQAPNMLACIHGGLKRTMQYNIKRLLYNNAVYQGRSKSFEPDYLLLDFWAKKCYWP